MTEQNCESPEAEELEDGDRVKVKVKVEVKKSPERSHFNGKNFPQPRVKLVHLICNESKSCHIPKEKKPIISKESYAVQIFDLYGPSRSELKWQP